MKVLLTKITALLCTVMLMFAGVSQSVIGYTDGTPIKISKKDYSFNDDTILIGGYYGGKGLAKYAKEAGLDFVIDTELTTEILDEYYENGVGVIAAGYNLPALYGDITDSQLTKWENIDIFAYKNHPAIWGDDLIDEPTAKCFDKISVAVDKYNKTFENKIALVNLFPIYANQEQLGEKTDITLKNQILGLNNDMTWDGVDSYKKHISDYINTVNMDYICADIYPYHSKTDKNGKEIKSTYNLYLRNLDILGEAARETGRNLWIITQAAGQTKNGCPENSNRWCDEVSDISQQAYASLSFGARCIIHGEFANKGWWDIDSHMIGKDGTPTDTYYAAQQVDFDLKNFGDVYAKYTYKSTYAVNKLRVAGLRSNNLNCTVPDEMIDIKSKNGLLVGTFDGDGKAYVITNMEELNNEVTAYATYKIPKGKKAVLYQQGKKTQFKSGDTVRMYLNPGEGVFLTVK